jgi:DNA-directed RNA polymerase specialized sigma24 family protein
MEAVKVVLNLLLAHEERGLTGCVLVTEQGGIWSLVWEDEASSVEIYVGEDASKLRQLLAGRLRQWENEGWKPLLPFKLNIKNAGAQLTAVDYYSDHHFNGDCYEELRRWRWDKAREQGISAFILATNRALKQLSTFVPQTEDQLEQIPALGAKQRKSHGEDILVITRKYESLYPYPLDWVAGEVDVTELEGWKIEQQERKTAEAKAREELEQKEKADLLNMVGEGRRLTEICQVFGRAPSTILKRVDRLSAEGYELHYWLQKEVDDIERAGEILALAQQHGTNLAKPIFEALHEDLPLGAAEKRQSYNEIRTILSYLKTLNHKTTHPADSMVS